MTYTKEQLQEIREVQELTYDLLEYGSNMVDWILEMDRKYHLLSIEDLERGQTLKFKARIQLGDFNKPPPTTSEHPEKPTKDRTESLIVID